MSRARRRELQVIGIASGGSEDGNTLAETRIANKGSVAFA